MIDKINTRVRNSSKLPNSFLPNCFSDAFLFFFSFGFQRQPLYAQPCFTTKNVYMAIVFNQNMFPSEPSKHCIHKLRKVQMCVYMSANNLNYITLQLKLRNEPWTRKRLCLLVVLQENNVGTRI